MTQTEALRLALEALEGADEIDCDMRDAITAIKAALEAKDEPFEYWNAVEGWVKIDEVRDHFDSVGCGTIYKTSGEDRVPLYTTPPQRTWVGLMRGVRVEGNAVVITVKGGNDEARALCGELINEMEKNT
jgi:hypothetical protein